MPRPLTYLLLLALVALTGCAGPAREYRWQRATSADPTGGNDDFVTLKAGESRLLADLQGPGTITHLWFTIGEFDANLSHRQLVLRITWDDAPGPSVLVPVGDFFGVGRGKVLPYENDFLTVQETDGLNAFFRMPFRRRARIEIVNESDREIPRLYYYITWEKGRIAPQDGYFHALYRQEKPAAQEQPYTVADLAGSGRFLGVNLSVVLNTGGWWGEGDDIITVDGERFQGTGSEDYFAGAWGFGGKASTMRRLGVNFVDKPSSRGGVWNLYRMHSESPIPFRKGLRFDLEHGLYGADARPVMANSYTSVAFYTLDEPRAQQPLPPLAERLRGVLDPPVPVPGTWIEAEDALNESRLYALDGSALAIQPRPKEKGWSGDAEVTLVAVKSGMRFVWAFDLPTSGTFTPRLASIRQPSGFDYDLHLNGRTLRRKVSGYSPVLERAEMQLPAVRLDAGRSFLELVATGSDPASVAPAIMGGLDAIRFDPADAAANAIDCRPSAIQGSGGIVLHHLEARDSSIVDTGSGASPALLEGNVLAGLKAGPSVLAFATPADRVVLDSPHYPDINRDLEITFSLCPTESDEMMVIFSRNQAMAAWLREGKLSFWLRDIDWRYLYLESKEGLVPANGWSNVRLTISGNIARIFVNGALCSELDMKMFRELNKYPGRMILGGSENQLSPFRGLIKDFTVRAGPAAPAAGEETADH
jgi:hypothetical protein